MKQTTFFPIYSIHSDLVKSALGLKDSRSIEKFFNEARIKVHDIGGKKCVMCEDLLTITKPNPQVFRYEAQSDFSKEIDDLE